MEERQFFKSLSWLLVLNLLIKPVWLFGIDRQVQNVVGHEAYGTYFALFNLCYVLLFMADAGLSNMVAQKLAATEALNLRQLLRLKGVLLGLYAAACLLVAWLSGVREWAVLVYLVLVHGLTSLFLFLRSLLTAKQYFITDAYFSVLDKSLLIALCAAPLYGFFRPMTILLFLQLQTLSISLAVTGLALFLYFKKEITAGPLVPLKALASGTAPIVLVVLLMAMHNRFDAFLLERLRPDGAEQAGIYAMAYRLLDAANMAGFLTGSFLVPFLARHQGNKTLMQRVVVFSRHGLLFLAAGVVAFVFVFAPWLLQVLYRTSGTFRVSVLQLCLLSLPAYYLSHIYSSALTATASFQPLVRILLGAVVVNSILNLWLIPLYGAVGCSVAALVSQYGCGLLLWRTASRKLQLSPALGTAFLYPAAAFLAALGFWLAQSLTQNGWIILSSLAGLLLAVFIMQRNRLRKVFLSFHN